MKKICDFLDYSTKQLHYNRRCDIVDILKWITNVLVKIFIQVWRKRNSFTKKTSWLLKEDIYLTLIADHTRTLAKWMTLYLPVHFWFIHPLSDMRDTRLCFSFLLYKLPMQWIKVNFMIMNWKVDFEITNFFVFKSFWKMTSKFQTFDPRMWFSFSTLTSLCNKKFIFCLTRDVCPL